MRIPGPVLAGGFLAVAVLLWVTLVVNTGIPAGDPEVRTSQVVLETAPGTTTGVPPAHASQAVIVDPAWVVKVARQAGIPEPALRAYATASLRLAAEQPACALGWTTLAGIGYVESAHGTVGSRTVGADGRSSTAILGPALDGRGPVAAIPATPDSLAWHGDPEWDHAMGPMQFIPSTWRTWASDGDADSVTDPHDLDDAAYAAGRYLCADGRSLATGDGWVGGVFSYNHSDDYVRAVFAAADAYAQRTG